MSETLPADFAARLVRDGVGHELAGEQDGHILVNRDIPGADGCPDLAPGLARRGRDRGQAQLASVQFGRTGRCHRVHRISLVEPDGAGSGFRAGGAARCLIARK